MHPTPFAIKQCHLGALRFGRDITAHCELTPGRLDMIRAIFEPGVLVLQSELRRRLGVGKCAISVMVRALVRLGFVWRMRCPDDKRTFVLLVTKKGHQALRYVYHDTSVEPALDLVFASAFDEDCVPSSRADAAHLSFSIGLQKFAHAHARADSNPWHANEDDDAFLHAPVKGNPIALLLGPERSDNPHDESGFYDEDIPKLEEDTDPLDRWNLICLLGARADRVRLQRRERRRAKRLARLARLNASPSSPRRGGS